VRAALARVPAAAWTCALIALLNAVAWSLITPPFQGKDEVDHYAYVQQLAETGTLPREGAGPERYSPAEELALRDIRYYRVRFTPATPTIATAAEQSALMATVHSPAPLVGTGAAGVATPEPPLYYALQLIPYALARGNVLAQLQLMRLLGALLAAVTAGLVFLFLRECLPAVPWAATAGTLCVAVQPLLGSLSASVNPETLLVTVVAALFLCLARAFRRKLDTRLALALGVLLAAGFMTKLNFLGPAFGVFVGLLVLAVREARARGRRALVPPALAVGVGLVPVLAAAAFRSEQVGSALTGALFSQSLFKELSYTWQLYLPRLPGMPHYFLGIATYKDIWFNRLVGLYGWMDTTFPGWVDNLALVPAGALALLCGREVYVHRAALRARLAEVGVFAAIALGVLTLIGFASYQTDALGHELAFGEPRYLLVLLPLLGAVVVLAVRSAGRRWAPVAGAVVVVLFLAHDVFSQLQVIARYYG
jgi:4-amino-4-deoxy-L-arabinose transferase-like glycosyltransferase